MLDSGAFSAWKKQTRIDVDSYGEYILRNLDLIDIAVNLDVIPGKWGDKGQDKSSVDLACAEGWKNYNRLLHLGVPKDKLMHVYHQEEDIYWLEKLMSNMEYVGFSPANDRTTSQKMDFLHDCFELQEKKYPHCKAHGFGVTSFRLMREFPWYSIDSTSWVAFAKYGIILIPRKGPSGYIYDDRPWKLFVSARSPKSGMEGVHYKTLPKIYQQYVNKYLETIGLRIGESEYENQPLVTKNCFFPEELPPDRKSKETVIEVGVCNSLKLRDQANLIFYQDFVDSLNPPKILYFAGNFPQMQNLESEKAVRDKVLERRPDYRRLISYHYETYSQTVLNMRKEELNDYKPRRLLRRAN